MTCLPQSEEEEILEAPANKVVLLTVVYETTASEEKAIQDLTDYCRTRQEDWLWKPGWTIVCKEKHLDYGVFDFIGEEASEADLT